MRGSILVTFDEYIDDRGIDSFQVNVDSQIRDNHFTDLRNYYSTFVFVGNVVTFTINHDSGTVAGISITRKDYTTDDEGGDYGIKDTDVTFTSVVTSTQTIVTFTATTRPDAYNFKYLINATTDGCFPRSSGFNGDVYDCEIQPDGKILVGGSFTQYSGTAVNNICRLNKNGTLDTTFNFNAGFLLTGVNDIKLLSDGSIIFTVFPRTIKVKSDGSLDTSFNIGTVSSSAVGNEEVIEILPNGKILVAGIFDDYISASQVSSKPSIVRLNPNGTIDTTFNQFGTGFTFDASVFDICVQPDGKILLAGDNFVSYDDVVLNRPGLIRLNADGTLDTSFIRNTSTDVIGVEVELLSDGKILFYNGLGGYNGNTNRRLVRLNPDGSLDTSFDSLALSRSTTANLLTFDMLVDNLDRTYIAGTNLIYSGLTIPSLLRINYDGTRDTSFNDGDGFLITTPSSTTGIPRDIELTSSGTLYAVGRFDTYFDGTSISPNIIKIKPDGTPFLC